MKFAAIAAALACSVIACADDAGPSGPVLLTGVDRYIDDTGEQQLAVTSGDVSVFDIGPGGVLIELAISETADGLVVSEAPSGMYYIQRGAIVAATSAREVDIGMVVLGRPNAALPSAPTTLDVVLSNMEPWQPGDAFQLYSAGAGLWSPFYTIGDPGADATMASACVDFLDQGLPLVNGSAGDRLFVTQLREYTTSAGHPYLSALRSVAATVDMALPDPQVAAALEPLPDRNIRLDWSADTFDVARQDVQPIALTAFYDFYLAAMPDGQQYGQYGAAADLVSFRVQDPGSRIDETFSYADAYAEQEWARTATIVAWYPVTYTLPGAARATVWDGMWNRSRWTDQGAVGGTPFVGPPTDVSVTWADGLCMAWQPPRTGAATSYQLTVYDLIDDGGVSRPVPAVGLRTVDTSTCVPIELLAPTAGGAIVQVGAVYGTDDVDTKPFATTLPYGYAEIGALAPQRDN